MIKQDPGVRPRRRRWPARSAVGLVVVLVAALIGVVVAYPVAAAAACPGCYGFQRAGSDLYVEDSATPDQRRQVTELIAAARRRVDEFYGDTRSSPRILVCLSDGCYGHLSGGGEKGQTVRDLVVALSPAGANVVIASHELAHAEQYHRLGSRFDQVPHWFNEGLAVLISDDPRYLTAKGAGDRCPVDYAQALAAIRAGRASRPGAARDFYRNSACVVDRWAGAHGGAVAVHDLIRRLLAGEPFTDIVVPA